MKRNVVLLAILLAAVAQPPRAEAFLGCWWRHFRYGTPKEPAQIRWGKEAGASVEMEVTEIDRVFDLVTVKRPDGTIRDILAVIPEEAYPGWLKSKETPERVQWDSLSVKQQKELIEIASRAAKREEAYFGKRIRPIPWLNLDGTIGDFMAAIKKAKGEVPEWLAEFATQKDVEVEKVRWEDLSLGQRRLLVEHTARATGDRQPYYAPGDRSIPWLTWKDTKVRLADGNEHSLRDLLDPHIEYGTPSDAAGVGRLTRVELHVRGGTRDPVATWNLAQDVQKGIGLQPTPLHLHIVVPMPKKFLDADPEVHGAVVARQWGLFNLLVELEARRAGIIGGAKKDADGVTFYDSLDRDGLSQAARWLTSKGKGPGFKLGSRLKTNDIGLRDESTYHRPSELGKDVPELMGWEMRFLSPEIAKKFTESLLARAAKVMSERNFAIPGEKNPGDAIRAWQKAHRDRKDLTDAMGAAYYHWGDLHHHDPKSYEEARGYWSPEVKPLVDAKLFQRMQELSPSNRDVWMLTHDWKSYSEGLLFTASAEQHAKILEAQKKALKALAEAEMPEIPKDASASRRLELEKARDRAVDGIMSRFQRESGLYELIKKTAGID